MSKGFQITSTDINSIDGMFIFDGFDLKFLIGWDPEYIKVILHLS